MGNQILQTLIVIFSNVLFVISSYCVEVLPQQPVLKHF
jgi:hypothetical protein